MATTELAAPAACTVVVEIEVGGPVHFEGTPPLASEVDLLRDLPERRSSAGRGNLPPTQGVTGSSSSMTISEETAG